MYNIIVKPISLQMANAFIEKNHRHSQKVTGHKFSLSLFDNFLEETTTVVIVGRPVARGLDNGFNLEILRICTNSWAKKNSISFLLSKVIKICKLMGYHNLFTYILDYELGSSLLATGFSFDCVCSNKNKTWLNRKNRKDQKIYKIDKKRYSIKLN